VPPRRLASDSEVGDKVNYSLCMEVTDQQQVWHATDRPLARAHHAHLNIHHGDVVAQHMATNP
jgi:hypothetical protein